MSKPGVGRVHLHSWWFSKRVRECLLEFESPDFGVSPVPYEALPELAKVESELEAVMVLAGRAA
jgi:hypothetical protein